MRLGLRAQHGRHVAAAGRSEALQLAAWRGSSMAASGQAPIIMRSGQAASGQLGAAVLALQRTLCSAVCGSAAWLGAAGACSLLDGLALQAGDRSNSLSHHSAEQLQECQACSS